MKVLKQLIKVDAKASAPIYIQITNSFIDNIKQGRLKLGIKLPGTRELAAVLKINRMTIVASYEELSLQGWIKIIPRKGTFVSERIPESVATKISARSQSASLAVSPIFAFKKQSEGLVQISPIPLSGIRFTVDDGYPDPRIAPLEHLFRAMRRSTKKGIQRKNLMYGDPQGTSYLRETLAIFLNETRALPVNAKNILITRGTQMGIFIAASLILKPGDTVVVGQPGYRSANRIFTELGAELEHVPVDGDGIDVNEIASICETKPIRLVYVIPHHHNPTTVTLSSQRRVALLNLAERFKFAIIEDDYDYDFHYECHPIMPMATVDNGGTVIYIGTLTKTLAPAVRIGFVVAPLDFIRSAVAFRRSIDIQGDTFLENGIAELYQDGTISGHIKKAVRIYQERRDHFCRLLTDKLGKHIQFNVPNGGMAVWAKFNVDLEQVATKAQKEGILMKNGRHYDNEKLKYNAVRLGFASYDEKEQIQIIEILEKCLS